jgi:hypothetical protein
MAALLRPLSYFLSLIGHPLLMVMYLLMFYLKVNPYLFPYSSNREMTALVLMILFTSVIIPIVSILLMLGVGFIDSVQMHKRTDRVGPLMVTGIFYIWIYLNIRTNSAIPIPYATFVLGTLFSLAMTFFVNNFSKISLHAVGLGGMLVGVLHLLLYNGGNYLSLGLGNTSYNLHYVVVLMVLAGFIGAVLSARLYLQAHINKDIYGGFVVGVLGQLVAYGLF